MPRIRTCGFRIAESASTSPHALSRIVVIARVVSSTRHPLVSRLHLGLGSVSPMADFLLALASITLMTGALLFGWRLLAGAPLTTARAVWRGALALIVAVTATGAGVYSLSSSRTYQLTGPLISRVETTDKVVALTFDDGPTAEHTQGVLDLLKAQEVTATFYLTGRECEENPAMLRAIIEAGHELGNHTYSHRKMLFVSSDELAREIERTDGVFEAAGYHDQTTFRPPGCKRLLATPWYLDKLSRATVTWDLEPDSGGLSGSPKGMVRQVAQEVRPGSIVLMHLMYDSREPSREALPEIIDRLRRQGYRFVTVSELLATR